MGTQCEDRTTRRGETTVLKLLIVIALIALVVMFVVPALRGRSRRGL